MRARRGRRSTGRCHCNDGCRFWCHFDPKVFDRGGHFDLVGSHQDDFQYVLSPCRTTRGKRTGISFSFNSVTFLKAAIPAQALFTVRIATIGAAIIYLGAIVTDVVERCMVRAPDVLIARNTLEIPEGVERQGLIICRLPNVVIHIDMYRRLRILGVGDLRPGRDDNGQGSDQQCAQPYYSDYREIGSRSHRLCLSPIGELSCHWA